MIKRLDQFVDDAQRLSWDEFKRSHDYHVVVLLPPDTTTGDPLDTSEFAARPTDTRPPISASYRVGLVKKKLGASTLQDISVGRDSGCDIMLRDIEVSKIHAFFANEGGLWTIRDNRSTNGTYVNGALIEPDQPTRIRSTDPVKFGPGLSAVFFSPSDFFQFLRRAEIREAFS